MRFATGILLGSVIGATSLALVNINKSDVRKMQRRGKKLMNKAEDILEDIKGIM